MKEYIEREALIKRLNFSPLFANFGEDGHFIRNAVTDIIMGQPTIKPAADVVEVVRCKDCRYFQPDFVLMCNGERRPYTEEEKRSKFGMVSCDVGINCGSRCERFGYWEENSIPVWFGENDFCSYGERKMDGKGE